MRRLDFISGAPQLAIFKEDANKTNLGGVLYLIYILVLLLLAIIYFFDFFRNEKYEFDYTLVKLKYGDNKLRENEDMKSMLETELEYKFSLYKNYRNPDIREKLNSSNFLIVDDDLIREIERERDEDGFLNILNDDVCIIEQGKPFKKSTKYFSVAVMYRCNGTDCTIRGKDKIDIYSYDLIMQYQGYSLEHQNPEKPIQILQGDNYWFEDIHFLENTNMYFYNWKLIEYEEEEGIFEKTYSEMAGKSSTYYGGDYRSWQVFTDDGHVRNLPNTLWQIKDEDGNHFIILLYFESFPDYTEYERYTRKEISFLDVLADVTALASSVLDLMALAYGFLYSQNYDNYKIIENILTNKMKIKINNINKIQEDDEKKKIELQTDLIINKTDEKEKLEIKEDSKDEEKEKKGSSENIDLPSPKLFDFLFNKLYSKCFGPSRKQALIDSCNDIVAKYTTIENLLYNQIKLEYLWKDYQWNNPQYEMKQKKDLISNLKEQ